MEKGSFIEIKGIGKKFGQFTALADINLSIRKGEFLTFLGPSGSGKTTMLNILAGFEAPTHGQVLLEGSDITPIPPEKRGFGMVFQGYALFPHFTVRENIAFSLRVRGVDADKRLRRTDEMMEVVELSAHAEKLPSQLSGGQKQRVALARSLAFEPSVLLLDEPLSALDKNLRESLRSELTDIQRRTRTTFVFVTHDQDEALSMSDRIAIFDTGRLAQVGTPEDLYHRPDSKFVAEFLGQTNLLETTDLRADQHEVTAQFEGNILRGSRDPDAKNNSSLLSVRTEVITVSTHKPSEDINMLQATLVERVFQGGKSDIVARLANGQVIRAEERRDTKSQDMPIGASVWVSWPPNDGRFLPSE